MVLINLICPYMLDLVEATPIPQTSSGAPHETLGSIILKKKEQKKLKVEAEEVIKKKQTLTASELKKIRNELAAGIK